MQAKPGHGRNGAEDYRGAERIKATLSDLRTWLGPIQITFTGGEALLKPYTIGLVEYGVSLGLEIEVLTHRYWKDQSKIEKLALARPWRVTISFDGLDAVHNKIRGRDDFLCKDESNN